MFNKNMFNFKSKIFKSDQVSQDNKGVEDYEEISEKRTSRLGNIFLAILVLFLIIIGQKVFSDVKDIPERPVRPSSCVTRYSNINTLKNSIHFSTCTFGEIDQKFGLDQNFEKVSPEIENITLLNRQIRDIQNVINLREEGLDQLLKKYNISLQEVIAGEQPLLDKPEIKASIISLNNEISSLNQDLADKIQMRDRNIVAVSPVLGVLNNSYKDALDYYKKKLAFYNLAVFLLKLLFVLPLFAASLHFYLKLKKKNSPYTIIASSVLTAASILFLQIVLLFLYQILPMEWLRRIFKALMDIPALKYIIYYGTALLVIAIFGGIVFYIQKKVFNPKKVAIRRLKDNKCPNCSFSLNPSYNSCPKCGRQLKEKCSNCGQLKIKDLPYCPFCGQRG